MSRIIHGIGTDILKISVIENSVADINDPFVQKTFTSKELDLILGRPIPLNSFATRFAGKEAVFKSLGMNGNHVRLNEIEILENDIGIPVVTLLGALHEFATQKQITDISISLSYDTEYAIAYAMALKN